MKYDDNEDRPLKGGVYDHLDGLDSVESSTEFTGLAPSLPPDEDEMESYSDMKSMPKHYKKPNSKNMI